MHDLFTTDDDIYTYNLISNGANIIEIDSVWHLIFPLFFSEAATLGSSINILCANPRRSNELSIWLIL